MTSWLYFVNVESRKYFINEVLDLENLSETTFFFFFCKYDKKAAAVRLCTHSMTLHAVFGFGGDMTAAVTRSLLGQNLCSNVE